MNNNNYNNIDALFSEHFDGKSVALTDSDGFWAALETKRSGRRRFAWLFLMLAMLGMSFSLWAYLGSDISNTTINNTASISSNNSELPNENIATAPISNDEEKEDLSKEEGIVKKQELNKKAEVALIDSNKKLTKSIINNTKTTTAVNDNTYSTKTEEVENIVRSANEGLGNDNINLVSSEVLMNTNDENFRMTGIEAIGINQYSVTEKTPQLATIANKPEWDKCYIRSRGNWFVDVYGQGVKVMETLESDQEDAPYRNAYDEKFSPAYGFMAGAMVGHKFSNGFIVSTGVEYQKYQTKYESEIRKVSVTRTWDPMAYFTIDANGNKVYVGDSVTVTEITKRNETIANNTTQLNIPIHLGIQIERDDWRYGFDVGAIVNISKKYEGLHMLTSRNITPLDKDNYDDFMTTKTGVSFTGGIHLGRMITKEMELYVSPRFRYSSANIFNDDQELSLKNNFAGVRVGLRYIFDN